MGSFSKHTAVFPQKLRSYSQWVATAQCSRRRTQRKPQTETPTLPSEDRPNLEPITFPSASLLSQPRCVFMARGGEIGGDLQGGCCCFYPESSRSEQCVATIYSALHSNKRFENRITRAVIFPLLGASTKTCSRSRFISHSSQQQCLVTAHGGGIRWRSLGSMLLSLPRNSMRYMARAQCDLSRSSIKASTRRLNFIFVGSTKLPSRHFRQSASHRCSQQQCVFLQLVETRSVAVARVLPLKPYRFPRMVCVRRDRGERPLVVTPTGAHMTE